MARAQQSKRDRGRAHEGLPPKQEPKYGFCPDCQRPIHNRGAHAEACDGQPILRCESRAPAGGSFGIWKQCVRPWGHEGGCIYFG